MTFAIDRMIDGLLDRQSLPRAKTPSLLSIVDLEVNRSIQGLFEH